MRKIPLLIIFFTIIFFSLKSHCDEYSQSSKKTVNREDDRVNTTIDNNDIHKSQSEESKATKSSRRKSKKNHSKEKDNHNKEEKILESNNNKDEKKPEEEGAEAPETTETTETTTETTTATEISESHEDEDDIDKLLEETAPKYDYEKLDPHETYNKNVLSFNMFLFRNTLLPIIFIVDSWVPKFIKTGYTNFFNNAIEPRNWLVHRLNKDKKRAKIAMKRFLVNTFFGVFGLINVAERKWGPEYKSKRISFDCYFRKKNKYGRYIISPLTNQYFEREMVSDMLDWTSNPIFYVYFPFNYLLYIMDKVVTLGKDKDLLYRNRKYSDAIYRALLDSEIYEVLNGESCK